MPHQDRLNIAVFIDFDNIEIGVKNTLGQQFDVGTILDAIKERGEVVTKIAYADWTRAGEYSRHLTQHAIRLVQRNLTPGGDKNGADINLALDALEMAFTHPHINAYVIVGGDSDFLSLVEKLKQYDKKVFVVGGRAFTSMILQRNCHEFIAYENLAGVRKAAIKTGRPMPAAAASAPIAQAVPDRAPRAQDSRRPRGLAADRAAQEHAAAARLDVLRAQLRRLVVSRFRRELAQAGLVQLKHAGRSVMVELNEGFEDPESKPVAVIGEGDVNETNLARFARPAEAPRPQQPQAPSSAPSPSAGKRSSRPATTPKARSSPARFSARRRRRRWPMYLRNVKQILRAYTGDGNSSPDSAHGFDERRYGFGGLMDLLRACQRDGFVRLERDRRGGLRVFQGPALQRQAGTSGLPVEASSAEEPMEAQPGQTIDADELLEAEELDIQPQIDSTAELLGRAKPRRPRTRAAASPSSLRGTRKAPAARKPAARSSAKKKPPVALAETVSSSVIYAVRARGTRPSAGRAHSADRLPSCTHRRTRARVSDPRPRRAGSAWTREPDKSIRRHAEGLRDRWAAPRDTDRGW